MDDRIDDELAQTRATAFNRRLAVLRRARAQAAGSAGQGSNAEDDGAVTSRVAAVSSASDEMQSVSSQATLPAAGYGGANVSAKPCAASAASADQCVPVSGTESRVQASRHFQVGVRFRLLRRL